MAYIGRQLVRGQNRVLDDISSSFNGSTTAFNLTVSSSSSPPASVNQLWIILGGILQKPGTDFTVADAVITFTTAPASTLSFWGMIQGDTSDINSPADASVTPSKIANSGDFAFPADVRFKDADGSHYVGLQAPSTVSSNLVWTLPAADGSANQLLKTDGSGALGWASDTQSNLLDEDNMSSNSATQPASQQSIKAYADTKAVLTGSTNNTITTVTGANAIQGEANLTFDGSTLAVTGNSTITYTGAAGDPTLTLGANNSSGSSTLTNNTSKACRVGVYHYANAEEPANVFYAVGSDTSNQVNYGGGTTYMNAATHHKFFTAADTTTVGGTEKVRIDGNGRVSVNTDTPHCTNYGVHIKTGDSGVTSASTNRDDIFIEGSDHTGITISTANNKTGGIGFDDPDGQGRGRVQYSHSSEKMQIYTSGTNSFEFTDDLDILDGNLKVAGGHGIDFSATSDGSGTDTSELLDDYEEGTWTGALVTGTATHDKTTYRRIGSVVHIWGRLYSPTNTSSNNYVTITGMPYAVADGTATGSCFGKDIDNKECLTVFLNTSEQLFFYGLQDSNAWNILKHSNFGSNVELYYHATYWTS
jgi:hypothetical protein